MNTDIADIVNFVSNNVSRFHAALNRIGATDNGEEGLNDEQFEAMMQESVNFLCADSPMSLEARKAAIHYQTDQVLSFLERAQLAPKSAEVHLKSLSKIGGKNFISGCTKRAQLIENVLQKTLNNHIQSPNSNASKTSSRSSM